VPLYFIEQLFSAHLLFSLAKWKSLHYSSADGYGQKSSAGFLASSQRQAMKVLLAGNTPGSASAADCPGRGSTERAWREGPLLTPRACNRAS